MMYLVFISNYFSFRYYRYDKNKQHALLRKGE